MSFSKLPKGACGLLMGLGWLSLLRGSSHELVGVEPDRTEKEHLVCSFACFDLHGLILLFIFYSFIQYLKRCTLLAEIAILPSGPL